MSRTIDVEGLKELFCKNIKNSRELSKIIDKYLIPQETEKKKNAEVSTPHQLRQEMLDKIPPEFWTKENKVFEPCCGKGGFLVDIVERFMIGLKRKYPDEKQRYKEIVEKCLYFSDINDMNIFICRLLLDPYNEYKLKYNEGDTLKLDIRKKWGVEGFEAVIGNPPYNSSGAIGTGNTIWQLFVKKALEEWALKGKGKYIVYVHPPGWRKPNTEKGKFTGLYREMVSKNYMRYLSIHGVNDGMKTFGCGTRYDWYVIERVECNGRETNLRDEKSKHIKLNLEDGLNWLPNSNINLIRKLIATDKKNRCEIIYSPSAYEHRKKWMSKSKTTIYKYPCIHSTPKNGVRFMYSSHKNNGHFGISKIIFGETGIYNAIIDMDGKYGLTNGSIGIKISSAKEGMEYKKFLETPTMKEIIESCSFSSFRVDWNIFKEFRKNFYMYLSGQLTTTSITAMLE